MSSDTPFRDRHRQARVVLADADGRVAGVLGPYRLDEPWFQEITDLVAQVQANHGIPITIVRLLRVDETDLPAMHVDYLAEIDGAAPDNLKPWRGKLDAQPLRTHYADIGGPRRVLEWAERELAERGHHVKGRTQMRTWNLSAIWRLQTEAEPFWLKSVPSFFAHEPRVLTLFAEHGEACMPELIVSRGQDMLLKHIPGEDTYDASREQMLHMAKQLVELQWRWSTRTDALLHVGVPNQGSVILAESIPSFIKRYLPAMSEARKKGLRRVLDRLPERLATLDRCGLPNTLVHGDYHPGNWRGEGLELTMLDWGDCVVGNPLLDFPGLLDRAGKHAQEVRDVWLSAWAAKVPDADLELGAEIAVAIADARMAVVFQAFLDQIEPSERVYHESDPEHFLSRIADAELADGDA